MLFVRKRIPPESVVLIRAEFHAVESTRIRMRTQSLPAFDVDRQTHMNLMFSMNVS